jgi:hypothetical protein
MGRALGRRIAKTRVDAIGTARGLYRSSSRLSAPFKRSCDCGARVVASGLSLNADRETVREMFHSLPDTRALWRLLDNYREPNSLRSIFELVITAVPFVVIWAVMWMSLRHGYWIGLLLVIPAAGFLVRLFMIQHDCGHGSFFRGRLANDWVGRAISVVTLTPYDLWRRSMHVIMRVQGISITGASAILTR